MKSSLKEKKIIDTIEEITNIKIDYKLPNINITEQQETKSIFLLFDHNKNEIARLTSLKDLENILLSLDKNIIIKYAKNKDFSKWLKEIGENNLSKKILLIEQEFNEAEKIRKKMIDILEENRYSINKREIKDFERKIKTEDLKLSHIGSGSFGGKARGIAFLSSLIKKYLKDEMFPGLKITIPRSIVISTDVFDSFMDNNNLSELDFSSLSDERISAKFMKANLPATIIGDLRAFINETRAPLILRSSSLLEDSLLMPFAGIYTSMLLPNESWGTEHRFQDVCNAIKYVYSSTYFEKARSYIKSTTKTINDEKMAVLIQEVVGKKIDNHFYPAISGVAKSYNYYPSANCKPEDGIVYLAMGLGRAIVDGGSSYCFCPEKPKAPLFGTPKDFIKYSQKYFYALNLESIYKISNKNEDTSVDKLDIDDAKNHGILDKIASTYFYKEDRLYSGVYEDGALVIDFGPIIIDDYIPLAKAIKLLLKIGEISLGYPVEIEFAVNFSKIKDEKTELMILQIRSMVPPDKYQEVNLENFDTSKAICYSDNALGNGIIENIKDIVFIKSESFHMKDSIRAVNQIKRINSKLMDEGKPYILVGPGRWGSADSWLGIPVIWSDIAGVKVIIETPYEERHIDPSQGSHFFHDMISSQVGYIITKKEKGNINWKWLNNLKLIEETEDIKHVVTQKSLKVLIDGKLGKAVIKEKE